MSVPHLISFASIFSYLNLLTQAKRNATKNVNAFIHLFFLDFLQRKRKRKNSDKFHRIGFLVVSVSVSHR